jgi:hypothetical protein
MGLAFSQYLFGFHTALEVLVGCQMFIAGNASLLDPQQADRNTPSDKMWKRVQASAMLTLAYLGYTGLTTTCPRVKTSVTKSCGMFHGLTCATLFWALKDGFFKAKSEAVIFNPHLPLALGFGAIVMGYID